MAHAGSRLRRASGGSTASWVVSATCTYDDSSTSSRCRRPPRASQMAAMVRPPAAVSSQSTSAALSMRHPFPTGSDTHSRRSGPPAGAACGRMPPVEALRRARFGLAALGLVTAAGTIGYLVLGFTPMNALYQTVTTISTVGFGEVDPMSARERMFTIVLILGGVGTAIYILSGLVEAVVDGELGVLLGR